MIGRLVTAALALPVACAAQGQEVKPLLDGMQVLNEASAVLDAHAGRGDSIISGPDFDLPSTEWRMMIERGEGASHRRFLVSINESSGLVCVREMPANDCAARGDASVVLQAARDKLRGLAEAAANPPPDLQGVMMAVIRHQLAAGGYLAGNRLPLFVSLTSPTGEGTIDLSAQSIRALDNTALQLEPGSAWKPPQSDTHVGPTMHMMVGIPTRRSDGDYDVSYGFWCGTLCASSHQAVLRHDASGWHVVSSVMQWIS